MADPLMAVVDCNVWDASGKICELVEQLINASTAVPPLLNATTQKRNGVPLELPSVAPVALVLIESADVTASQIGSPLACVVSRNGIRTGFVALGSEPLLPLMATVRRFEATEQLSCRLMAQSTGNGGLTVAMPTLLPVVARPH